MTGAAVSVVIPVLDGAATIGRQLDALAAQRDAPPFEVVVADNGSADGTADIVRAHRGLATVRVVDASRRRGVNAARNAGTEAAVHERIVLCDADDIAAPGWLAAYTRAFATGGELLGGPLDRRDGRALRAGPSRWLGFLPYADGANLAYTRAVWSAVGAFDERIDRAGGDEVAFSWKAQLLGHDLVWVPEAVMGYSVRRGTRAAVRQHFRYGESHALLYDAFRDVGMPPRTPKQVAGSWASMVRRAHHLAGPEPRRRKLACDAAVLAGRVAGSWRHRVVYF
jgi:glycosyltransferase involved in cell wall biosynthesis